MATPVSLGVGQAQRSRSATPGQLSDTSGALHSDDEFSSIGYSYERPETEEIIAPPKTSEGASCSYADGAAHHSQLLTVLTPKPLLP